MLGTLLTTMLLATPPAEQPEFRTGCVFFTEEYVRAWERRRRARLDRPLKYLNLPPVEFAGWQPPRPSLVVRTHPRERSPL